MGESNAETCILCGQLTGRAGAGDDSIFDNESQGPYCEDCYELSIKNLDSEIDRLKPLAVFELDDDPGVEYYYKNIAEANAGLANKMVARFKELLESEKRLASLVEKFGCFDELLGECEADHG